MARSKKTSAPDQGQRNQSTQNDHNQHRNGNGGGIALPSNVTLALWQLRQTWRLLLITGLGIVAAVVLICAVPLYSQVTTTAGLRSSLNSLSGNADIAVHSNASAISAAHIQNIQNQLNGTLATNLGQFISGAPHFGNGTPQFVVHTQGLPFLSNKAQQRNNTIELNGAAMQQAQAHVKILQGRLPLENSSIVEIALLKNDANALAVKVGDTLKVDFVFNEVPIKRIEKPLTLSVVGIFSLLDKDTYWHGEDFEGVAVNQYFTSYRALMSNAAFLSMISTISTDPSVRGIPFETPVDLYWYYHLDTTRIDVSKLDDLLNGINAVLVNVSNNPVDPPYVAQTQAFGPSADALDRYRSRLSVLQIPVTSITLLVIGLVLFFVSLMTDLLVDRQENSIAIMRSRGASRRQIFGSFVTQSVWLGVVALLVGPLLAIFAVQLLVQSTLSSSDQGALNIIGTDPGQVTLSLGLSALIAVAAAVAAMILAIFRATRLDVLSLRRESARTTQRPLWLRLSLDVVAAIIALTGYGFSSYVTSPGVLDAHTRVLVLSPLTLVGSIFLLLGFTLLFLRVFPLLLRMGSWLAARSRSASPILAFAQMARAPRQSIRMTLLLALSIAFAIFTLIFTASQAQRIPDVAAYQVGADFSGQIPGSVSTQQIAHYSKIHGVTSATPGYSSSSRASQNGLDISVELRAVDADTYAKTVIWTKQDSTDSLAALTRQLTSQRKSATDNGFVPAIVDATAWSTLHLSIGAPFTLSDINGDVNFTTVGEVQHIPTVNDSTESSNGYLAAGGILVDLQTYANVAAKLNNSTITPNMLWLRTSDNAAALNSVRATISTGNLQLNQIADRRALIESLSNDPLYLALVGLLALGAITALLLALVGDLTASWLNARSRLTNFAVLRALGGSQSQIASVLLWEQSIVYATAILLGILFGILLSALALPALVFTSVSGGGSGNGDFFVLQSVPPIQMIVPLSLAIVLAAVIVICLVAITMMVRIVSRPSMSQTLRLNED